jgi:hypothetical protein
MNTQPENIMAEPTDTNRPAAPHYDPTDDHGNSKERVKPSVSITPETDLDPARKQRAKEVLEGFEGQATPTQPDSF